MNIDSPPYQDPMDIKGEKLTWSWLQWIQKLVRTVNLLLGSIGGQYLNAPYGQISSTVTQNTAAANTPTLVTFDTSDFLNGMTRVVGDGIKVAQAGLYNYQFSMQVANPTATLQEVTVWLKKNGTDIPGTASKFGSEIQHGAIDGYLVMACNFYVQLAAGDSVELWWAATDTTVNLEAYPAQTVPYARPSIPSVVVTLTFVSAL